MTSKHTKNREILYDFLVENQKSFYRVAYSYVKNCDTALDIVQESISKALSSYDSLREAIYMKTWFYRILVNTSITYLRGNKKYELTEDVSLYEGKDNIESLFDNKSDSIIDLYSAIDKLNENQKSLILLRYFEDIKIADIACILQIPESTVKTRLRATLDKLSKII